MKKSTKSLLILWGTFIGAFLIGSLACIITDKLNFLGTFCVSSCVIGTLLILPSLFLFDD